MEQLELSFTKIQNSHLEDDLAISWKTKLYCYLTIVFFGINPEELKNYVHIKIHINSLW